MSDYTDARHHYEEELADSGHEFADFALAYTFGRKQSLMPHLIGKRFDEVDEALRARYEEQHPDALGFDVVGKAVRWAFEEQKKVRPGYQKEVTAEGARAAQHGLESSPDDPQPEALSDQMANRPPKGRQP